LQPIFGLEITIPPRTDKRMNLKKLKSDNIFEILKEKSSKNLRFVKV
jgi:hypothetical protein